MTLPAGYVDLQVNGHGGVEFSSPELRVDDFRRAAATLLEEGTAVFLPTLITAPPELYRRNAEVIRRAVELEGWQKHIPGIHLEGPFLSPAPGAIGLKNLSRSALPTTNIELSPMAPAAIIGLTSTP